MFIIFLLEDRNPVGSVWGERTECSITLRPMGWVWEQTVPQTASGMQVTCSHFTESSCSSSNTSSRHGHQLTSLHFIQRHCIHELHEGKGQANLKNKYTWATYLYDKAPAKWLSMYVSMTGLKCWNLLSWSKFIMCTWRREKKLVETIWRKNQTFISELLMQSDFEAEVKLKLMLKSGTSSSKDQGSHLSTCA